MSRKHDDIEPETFGEALEAHKVGPWLRSQVIWMGGFGILIGLGYLYFQIFPSAPEKPKIDVVAATAHVQAMWKRGDQAGAIRYYADVADQRAPGAEYVMGVLYESATGKLHDDREAAKWFLRASDQGNAAAKRELALLYRDGAGVAKNDGEALALFRTAAEAGNANAQADLAQSYENGTLGLDRDPAEAFAWYGRAAAGGNILAQVNLSDLLFKGTTAKPDFPAAYRWARLAAARTAPGTPANRVASENAAEARAKLKPREIAEADLWIKNWTAQPR